MLISFEDAHSALSGYFPRLWSIVDGAWVDYETKIPPEVRAVASPRSRASLVHDFMVKRSFEMAEACQGVSIVKHKLMFTLVFESAHGFIAMRLKKLGEDGTSKNHLTKQVIDFRNQIEIPGIGARFHLEVGYILNKTQDSINSIELVCPSGNKPYWMAEVTPLTVKENLFSLWEHRGAEEQEDTGFTVTRRRIEADENNASN
jgi:hypothetical protein